MLMCHLLASTVEELHSMAQRIGMGREWLQTSPIPHYDICQAERRVAIEAGAIVIDGRKTVAVMRHLRQTFPHQCRPSRAVVREACQ
jgi:Protein of unknown function (DUF4031)